MNLTPKPRPAIGEVVRLTEDRVVLELDPRFAGHVAAHASGVSTVATPGTLIGFQNSAGMSIAIIVELRFGEDRSEHQLAEPFQELILQPVGVLTKSDGHLTFNRQGSALPTIGSSAYVLSTEELTVILSCVDTSGTILLGDSWQEHGVVVNAALNDLLGRHVAVVGGTGEGKTTFVSRVLQELCRDFPKGRVVIFDVNGEYSDALANSDGVRVSTLGSDIRIPYYALNRTGLISALLPSEKSQMPALRFAIEALPYVEFNGKLANPTGAPERALADDCRLDGAKEAMGGLRDLRDGQVPKAASWPHMRALGCLVAEWGSLQLDGRGNVQRSAFQFGSVQPLVNRIRGLCEDPQFNAIVDVNGGHPTENSKDGLDLDLETRRVIDDIFGPQQQSDDWSVHVVDLHRLPQDLMPTILGSLLDLFSAELFQRGPGVSHPTLLVLEEAHHYLRLPSAEAASISAPPYERLAKEGRKFNLSLLVSTQRPYELSQTVLSQCGTWVVFRLTNELDQRAVKNLGDWLGDSFRSVSSLPRGEAFVIGAAVDFPTRIMIRAAQPPPRSSDANFEHDWSRPK